MNSSRSSLRTLIIIIVLLVVLVAIIFFGQNAFRTGTTIPTRAAVAALPQATQTAVAPSPTPEKSHTPGPSPTPTHTLMPTRIPTDTPIPTRTPTRQPQLAPTLDATIAIGTLLPEVPTPETPIPTAVPTFEVPDGTTNILLLGSDVAVDDKEARTDTIIIVAVNRDSGTASMISLPRDLYVYIPGSVMNRINTAMSYGKDKGYEGGGIGLLKQTILYNFGIPIHNYARVDFQSFQNIVDAMGGVDVAVSCRLQDWRLKSPELNIQDEDNWEQFALEPGIYHMDGDLALWYARSRLTTSDFDRGRRQQQLLRAMLNQGVDLGLISEVPTLWNTFKNDVETDVDIGLMLQLAALAPSIRENGVQNLYAGTKVTSWTVPSSGASVLLPIWEGDDMMQETLQRLFRPPALSRANRAPIYVEIVNATDNPDLARLTADNLAYQGFIPVISPDAPQENDVTAISYYGANFKGSYDWLLSWVMAKSMSSIELITDDNDYPYDYKVVLGDDYDPCRPALYAPQGSLSD